MEEYDYHVGDAIVEAMDREIDAWILRDIVEQLDRETPSGELFLPFLD